MIRKNSYIGILLIFIFMAFSACKRDAKNQETYVRFEISDSVGLADYMQNYRGDTNSIDYYGPIWGYLVRKGDHQGIVDFSTPIYERSKASGYEEGIIYSAAYLAQMYLYYGSPDSLRIYLDEIVKHDINDPKLRVLINSIEGIYALRYDLDYTKSMNYFVDSQDMLKELGSHMREVTNLCNISYIYILRSDPLGYKFAKEALDLCRKYQLDSHFECISQISVSELLLLNKSFGTALEAIEKAEELAIADGLNYLLLNIYSTKLKVYSAIGSEYDALEALHEAEKHLDEEAQTADVITFYYNAGIFYSRFHKDEEALKCFYKVLELSYEHKEVIFRKEALLEISRIQDRLGNEPLSYVYLKRSKAFIDSVLNIQKERDFSHYQLLLQKSEHEKTLQQNEIELLKANRKIYVIVSVFVLILIIVAFLMYYVVHQNRMYAQLVKIHQKNLRKNNPELLKLKEKQPEPQTEPSQTETPLTEAAQEEAPVHPAGSVSSDEIAHDPDRELYEKIESLMINEKLFTDKELTLEKIAGILNSNRTYVSRAINNFAGCGFISYVNTYRINEATRILAVSDIPLKQLCEDVGFVSSSTFYRAFQKETGCSPSRYRTELIKLNKNEGDSSSTD